MKNKFNKAVAEASNDYKDRKNEILRDKDIEHLPPVVQKYLRYVGAIGKEKVMNFRAEFRGGIRSKPDEEFMKLKSVQFNFVENPIRLFYIVARKKGIPAVGLHWYRNAKATFQIKLLGLFKIVDARGKEMDQGETVTVFNDMCLIAPASLIHKNIKWEIVDDLTVKAKFTNNSITIGATLYFNEQGELVNFISDDRFETLDGKKYNNYPWLTPVTGYKDFNGYRLASGAELIYKRPEGDFCYGNFELVKINYNGRQY